MRDFKKAHWREGLKAVQLNKWLPVETRSVYEDILINSTIESTDISRNKVN